MPNPEPPSLADYPELPPEAAKLGPLLEAFTVPRSRMLFGFIAGAVLFVTGLGLLIAAIFFMGWEIFRLDCALVGLIAMPLGGLGIMAHAYNSSRRCVLLFRDGLVSLGYGPAEVWHWEQARHLTLMGALSWQTDLDDRAEGELFWLKLTGDAANTGLPGTRSLIMTYEKTGNQVLRLDDYLDGFNRLSRVIQRETLKRLLPGALDAHLAGEEQWFGPVGADSDRLRIKGGTVIRWEDLGEVAIERVTVVFRLRKGGQLSVKTAEVMDLHLLLALIEAVRPREEGARDE